MKFGGVSSLYTSKKEGRKPPCGPVEGVCGDLGCVQMGHGTRGVSNWPVDSRKECGGSPPPSPLKLLANCHCVGMDDSEEEETE